MTDTIELMRLRADSAEHSARDLLAQNDELRRVNLAQAARLTEICNLMSKPLNVGRPGDPKVTIAAVYTLVLGIVSRNRELSAWTIESAIGVECRRVIEAGGVLLANVKRLGLGEAFEQQCIDYVDAVLAQRLAG